MSDVGVEVIDKGEQNGKDLIAYTYRAAKLTEEVIKKMLQKIEMSDNKHDKYSTTTVEKMAGSNNRITVMDEGMLPNTAKRFFKDAGKLGISFTMLKNSATDPPTYQLCFYEKDSKLVKNTVSNFLAKESKRLNKQSLLKRLDAKVKEAKALNKERQTMRAEPERSR